MKPLVGVGPAKVVINGAIMRATIVRWMRYESADTEAALAARRIVGRALSMSGLTNLYGAAKVIDERPG